jgi:hypothetical protein
MESLPPAPAEDVAAAQAVDAVPPIAPEESVVQFPADQPIRPWSAFEAAVPA